MNDSLMLALDLAVVGMVACLFFAKPVDKVRGHPGRIRLNHKRKADSARDGSNSSGTDPDAEVTASTEARPADETQTGFLRKRTRKNPSKP